MGPMKQIGIVMGSTRPGNNCTAIAECVLLQCCARAPSHVSYEIIDLADWKLPLLDEPGIPAEDPPVLEHTRAWSKKVAGLQGFVFVSPQYNWGYPAVLKNALDFLYSEWNGKPAAIVCYGGRGGLKCFQQLQQVLQGLRMRVDATPVSLILTKDHQQHGVDLQTAQSCFATHQAEVSAMAARLEQQLSELV